MLAQVEQVAPTDSTVLIQGETGTGKELFARAIHSRSAAARTGRSSRSTAARSRAGLVESELFGHVRGALHRRARQARRPVRARRRRDDLPRRGRRAARSRRRSSCCASSRSRSSSPWARSRTIRVDVRVIAATNRDLEEAVREGRFRADLLLPAERLSRAGAAAARAAERHSRCSSAFFVRAAGQEAGQAARRVQPQGMERLTAYAWPGNVRELAERRRARGDPRPGPRSRDRRRACSARLRPRTSGSPSALVDVERGHILSVLKTTRGVVEGPRGAAQILGLHPNTLRSRIKKLGISRRLPRHFVGPPKLRGAAPRPGAGEIRKHLKRNGLRPRCASGPAAGTGLALALWRVEQTRC